MSAGARIISGESGGRDTVTLVGPDAELAGTFLPGLGMVGSSLRHHDEELLGQRGGPDAYAERKSQFAIPLLHPWANRLSDWDYTAAGRDVRLNRQSPVLRADPDTGLPLHGALTASPYWKLTGSDAAGDEAWLEAQLEFGAHSELMEVFPFAHRLEFRAGVSRDALTVRLTVVPTADQPVPIAFGFHPFIALPGSDRRDWQIELPVRRRVILDEHGIPSGEHQELSPGALSGRLGERTFDDSFDELSGDPRPVFSVSDSRRRVSVRFGEGYPVAQVFAPENSPFIAFEPMTAPVDALRSGARLALAAPGETFTAEFAVSVSSAVAIDPEG